MIKIRLARGGRKFDPVYTIVASDVKSPRDGKFLAKLGKYFPHRDPSLEDVNGDEISKWLKDGAQMSDTVRTLLKKHKIEIAN
jgi:small subunit ribosomal protein S16